MARHADQFLYRLDSDELYRTKQIESLAGCTLVSEGVDANYMDMMNYAVFGLIKLTFGE